MAKRRGGEVSGGPRPLLRDALEEHFLRDIDPWFTYLEARNTPAHIYNRDQADKVCNAMQGFQSVIPGSGEHPEHTAGVQRH
jgi:hypothetical protein